MHPAARAIMVKQARLSLRERMRDQRRSDNFEDRGGIAAAPFDRRGARRTWQNLSAHTHRQFQRRGVNRHRAAIRGRNGEAFATHRRYERLGLGL